MFNIQLDYKEFSLVAQSILLRIDYVTNLLNELSHSDPLRGIYANELSALCALRSKLDIV